MVFQMKILMENWRLWYGVNHLMKSREDFWRNMYVAEFKESGGGTRIML